MTSPQKELRKVSFTPKHEAAFLCPESETNSFLDFLASESIRVTRQEPGAASDSGQIIVIEVADVDFAEGEALSKKFNQQL
jgi:hypothetical protein